MSMSWLTYEIFPLVTMLAYFATAIRIVTFRRRGLSHRRQYSALASVMVGVLLYSASEILILSPLVSPGQCAISLMFFFAAFRTKGNVAAMLRIREC